MLITLVAAATCGAGLGRPAIGDSDEAFYAEAAREMIETGDWLTPHYNYAPRFQKPVLYYWCAALAYLAGGATAAGARAPAALAALGLAWATYFIGRRAFDAATGRLAALVVATSFGMFFMGRQALPDVPLALFVTVATWALLVALLEGRASEAGTGTARWLAAAAVFAAAGLLAKGPVGVVLPLLVALPLAVWERGVAVLKGATWRVAGLSPARAGLAALLFVLVAVPWYAAMVRVHGWQYLRDFLVTEHLERFATERFNEPRPLWFYLPIMAGGLLPWSPLALLWVRPARAPGERSLQPAVWRRRLVAWVISPLLFFSLSVGKQPRYILPLLPPLAVLLAREVVQRTRCLAARSSQRTRRRDALLGAAGVLSALLMGAGVVLVSRLRPLLVPTGIDPGAPIQLTMATAAAAVAAAAVIRQRWLPTVLVAAATAYWLAVHYGVLSSARPEPVERVASLVAAHRNADEPVGRFRVVVRNLVFYTRVPHVDLLTDEDVVRFLRSPRRVLCVLDEADLERLRGAVPTSLTVLGVVPYVNTLNLQLRTVLWPDPVKDVRRLVVVANRAAPASPGAAVSPVSSPGV